MTSESGEKERSSRLQTEVAVSPDKNHIPGVETVSHKAAEKLADFHR